MFKIILDFLRSGFLEEISNNNLMKLQVEAEYFQLSSLSEIIKHRLGVEEQNNSNSKDEVNVIVEGQTFKCKPHVLQYCDKKLIDQNGDFNARDIISRDYICLLERDWCGCDLAHAQPLDVYEITLEDLVRRVLSRLEENRVGDVEPPRRTVLSEDTGAARGMGLLPGYPNKKCFF